jgi:hypothetical protein
MNAKHQFKYTSEDSIDEISPVEITYDFPGEVTISQMLYNFESYLKAVGFVFDGRLDIVPEDVCDDTIDDTSYCCMGDSSSITDEVEYDKLKNKWVHGICNPLSK